MRHLPYSRNTYEAIEAIHAPNRDRLTRTLTAGRIEQKRSDHYKQAENIKVTVTEIQELLGILDGDRAEHREVDLRSLGNRLRLAEVELMAAVEALAGQMGMVSM